jgi:ABC-type uncharacterized transport system substrate-binding protein
MTMRRRHFITLLGGAAAWPLAARAQQPAKIPRLGYMTGDSESADLPRRNAFRQGLRELGYDEGQTILIEFRTAAGGADKLAEFAAEFSRLDVDVVFAFSTAAVQAAAKAMPTKPIVSITPDPVLAGLVSSLARPGGNITGLSTLAGTEIYSKYLELLKETVPGLKHVAVLSNPGNTLSALAIKAMETAVPTLGLSLQVVEARKPDELEKAVAAATKEHAEGLVVVLDALFLALRTQLAELVARYRLPTIYGIREHAETGGLIAYAANRPEMFRRAAYYVDKILKGTRPAELPIEQPTKFELIINLKAAEALNLAIAPSLLVRADEVIE